MDHGPMKSFFLLGLMVYTSTLFVCGCQAAGDLTEPEDTEEAASAASYDDNTVVSRLGDGLYQNIYGIEVRITESGPTQYYYNDWGYWIDLQVQNLAYEKTVGVIWTADDWTTSHVSYASYEADIGGGYERWGLNITGRSYSLGVPTIQYAAFAEMNEDTYYGKEDNWKNYTISP